MSTPIIRVKVTPRTVIKGKMDVRFPASVSAESPILLTKAGGSYSFGFDMNVVLEAVNFGGFVLGPSSAVDGHIPLFDGATGKKLKDGKAAPVGDVVGTTDAQTLANKTLTAPAISSPTGLVKADVGLGNVDNTSDATKNAAAATLTNKTINASNNTVSNLTTSMFAANVVDNDGTLAANSSTRVPTQAAVKAYADQVVAATDAMVFKGVIDCSANPNYPAADRGWTYKVSVAGKIGGVSGVTAEVGDTAMCLTDGTASGDQATVGANWNIVQANLVGAVTGPASSTSGNIATFNGTGGTVIQDGGKALPSGALVGTSDTQTLTGKTLDTASNTFKLNGVAFGTATQATAALSALVGDTGSGGTKGLAPAPGSGDASAGKFLKADGTWAVPPGGGGGGRTVLTGNATYYVRTDGSDSNNGLANTSGGAFLTIQKAVDTVASLDIAGFNVVIQIADGTYTGSVTLKNVVGFAAAGNLVIQGNNTTPANVLINVSSTYAILADGISTVWDIKDLKIQSTGYGISARSGAKVRFGNVNFAACSAGHIQAFGPGSVVTALSNYAVSGGGNCHFECFYGSQFVSPTFTVTITNTPAFSVAWAQLNVLGSAQVHSMTFTGSATGPRFYIANGAVLFTNGSTASTYLPGNAAGAGTNFATSPYGLYA